MKNNSKLIQFILIFAGIAVVFFGLIQLSQHGYDAPKNTAPLIVDVRQDDGNIESRFNAIENELIDLKGRLQKIERKNETEPEKEDKKEENKQENKEEKKEEYRSPTDIIYDNPLNNKKCQNAILSLEDIDIDKLISIHSKRIPCTKNQNWRPYIWTREGIGSLINEHCYRPHTPIRTTNEYMDIIKNESSLIWKKNDKDIPIYYHIPKCASSSTAGMLSDHFNFKQQWVDGPETNHQTIYTKCGFTFVRNPIHRFISGYYTVNNMLWRECLDENGAKTFINHTNEKYKNYKFIGIIGEPQRFEAYIDELFSDPYHFGKTLPFRHTGSQMYFLSNWYGSDIQFIGRVEQYEKHWNELMELETCKWFKQNIKSEIDKINIPNSMYHYGFYGPTLYKKSYGEKKEYVDALGMRSNLEKMYSGKIENRVDPNDILAPAYYFITKQIFERIIKYFWQDFICFDYPTDYNNFKNYVNSYS